MIEPIRLRASSLWELLDCPLRWRKRHLEGMKLPSTPPAAIGTAVHASTAAFDQSRIDGSGLTIDDTAGLAVDLLKTPDDDVDWMGMRLSSAVETALRVHTRYCVDVSPTQTYAAVEATLSPLDIDMGDGLVFRLTGTLDRVREDEWGQRGVSDVKTGGRAVDADGSVVVDKHLPQVGEYELLAEREFGPMELPGQIIGLHTGSEARVGIGDVPNARRALVGDEFEPGLLQHVSQYFKTGMFPPNPGSNLCSKRYCPFYDRCIYHG